MMQDLDPAAPAGESEGGDAAVANRGIDLKGDFAPGDQGLELAPAFGITTINFAIDKALTFLDECETSHPRVTYRLGKKIRPGQLPGRSTAAVSCARPFGAQPISATPFRTGPSCSTIGYA
jgi:hypothetical protein